MPSMETTTLLLFSLTVLPLICTPGPDMLFIVSQAIGGSTSAGLRATAGVCAGYCVHSVLVALGLAAIVAASPVLFETLRWIGVAYLAWLAFRLLRSALKAGRLESQQSVASTPFRRGFLTAVLNPKGMMIYVAILPQFMHTGGSTALQALVLSAIFIGLCGVVYALLVMTLVRAGRVGGLGDRRRRWIDGVSGGLVALAAGKLAAS